MAGTRKWLRHAGNGSDSSARGGASGNAGAIHRIRDLIPHAKLIAIVRDPVERAHSNWTHLWSAGREPIGDFVLACAEEERRVASGWSAFWHYTGLGRYGEQFSDLLALFLREQVLILRYRRLLDEPAQVLDEISAFLGVEQGIVAEIPRENVTAHPDRSAIHAALSRALRGVEAAGRHLPGAAGTAVTTGLERFLQRDARPRQPLTWDERQAVLPRLADDIRLLGQVIGEDFSDWLQPRERSGGQVGARPAGQYQARNGRVAPRLAGAGRRPQLGPELMRAVSPGQLVIQAVPPVGQGEYVQVTQPSAAVARLGGRTGCGRRESGWLGAGGNPGPFLVVLGRAGPAVIKGGDRAVGPADCRHARAAGVPRPGAACERGPVPGPFHSVCAGRVAGDHLVGFAGVDQRMACGPQLPAPVMVPDHRVLDPGLGVAGQHHHPVAGVEPGWMTGLEHLNPPVLRAGSGAAQVQPPATGRIADQGRPFSESAANWARAKVSTVSNRTPSADRATCTA
jgi:sulfotransferase family protein